MYRLQLSVAETLKESVAVAMQAEGAVEKCGSAPPSNLERQLVSLLAKAKAGDDQAEMQG